MRASSANESRPETRRHDERDPCGRRTRIEPEERDQFRRLLEQGARPDETGASDAPRDLRTVHDDSTRLPAEALSAETAALLHAHRLVLDLPQQVPNAPTLAASSGIGELIEKHVRRMLVTAPDQVVAGRDRQVLLRLSDDTLPGTDLTLTRGESGWELRAEVASPTARDALRECAPALIERFAENGLGSLHIETVLRSA